MAQINQKMPEKGRTCNRHNPTINKDKETGTHSETDMFSTHQINAHLRIRIQANHVLASLH